MAQDKRDNDPKTERDNGNPDVVFRITGDTPEPRQAPWGFIIRNPLARNVMPREQVKVDLGISCNVPMLVFPSRVLAGSVFPVLKGNVLSPGENLVVMVQGPDAGQFPLLIEDLEPLVNLHPLLFTGTFVVD